MEAAVFLPAPVTEIQACSRTKRRTQDTGTCREDKCSRKPEQELRQYFTAGLVCAEASGEKHEQVLFECRGQALQVSAEGQVYDRESQQDGCQNG